MLNKSIKINEKEYTLKNTLRVEMMFEYVKGTPFELKDTNDWRLYFYCMIKANNEYDKPYISEDGDDFISSVSGEDLINFINIVSEHYNELYNVKDKKEVKKKRVKKS